MILDKGIDIVAFWSWSRLYSTYFKQRFDPVVDVTILLWRNGNVAASFECAKRGVANFDKLVNATSVSMNYF